MENTAYAAPSEEVAYATVRAARLGVSRSRYIRAGLVMAATATDVEVLAAIESLPARKAETWKRPLGHLARRRQQVEEATSG